MYQEIVVDNFAGGGGASEGIKQATGRDPDVAINHDREAIAMHAANHPGSKHYQEDIWQVDPLEASGGRPVGLAWFSPDCTHFSKAKGGQPRKKEIRGLAWVVIRWAKAVRPRVIMLENVEEFRTWGPLDAGGFPIRDRKGETFREWEAELRGLGYDVEFRELRAADYGAPTIRRRLFIIARCDGQPIVWPEPSHGGEGRPAHRAAAECIDWSLPCPSIFTRKRPLAEATLRRIATGIKRFVIEAEQPFILTLTHQGNRGVDAIDEPIRTITGAHRGEQALVSPTLIQVGYGEREGQAPRVPGLLKPLGTVVAGGAKHAVVAPFLARTAYKQANGSYVNDVREPFRTLTAQQDGASVVATFLTKFYGTNIGQPLNQPMPTVTSTGQHIGEVRAFLAAYYGNEKDGQPLSEPMRTVTSKERFALVMLAGEPYEITDIGMRMLTPRELYHAQGFPSDYVIDPTVNGRPLTKTAQVRMCGNSVCPPLARALVAANVRLGAASTDEIEAAS